MYNTKTEELTTDIIWEEGRFPVSGSYRIFNGSFKNLFIVLLSLKRGSQ